MKPKESIYLAGIDNVLNVIFITVSVLMICHATLPLVGQVSILNTIYKWAYFLLMPGLLFSAGAISSRCRDKKNSYLFIISILSLYIFSQYTYTVLQGILDPSVAIDFFYPKGLLWIFLAILVCQIILQIITNVRFPFLLYFFAWLISVVSGFEIYYIFEGFYYFPFFVAGFYLNSRFSSWSPKRFQRKVAFAGLLFAIIFSPLLKIHCTGFASDFLACTNSKVPSLGVQIANFIFNSFITICFFVVVSGRKNIYPFSSAHLLMGPLVCGYMLLFLGGAISGFYTTHELLSFSLVMAVFLFSLFICFTPVSKFIPWFMTWSLWVMSSGARPGWQFSSLEKFINNSYKYMHYLWVNMYRFVVDRRTIKIILFITPFLLSVFLVFFVVEWWWRGTVALVMAWVANSIYLFCISALVVFIFYCILRAFFSNAVACILLIFTFCFASVSNVLKIKYWGEPLVPSDLHLSAQLYQSVKFLVGSWVDVIVSILVLVAFSLIYFLFIFRYHVFNKSKWALISGLVAVFSGYVFYFKPAVLIQTNSMPKLWQVNNLNEQYFLAGVIPAFIYNFITSHVVPPAGYNSHSINKLVDHLPLLRVQERNEKPLLPNIVIIQSEAFWDPGHLSAELYPDGSPGDLAVLCAATNKACKTGYVNVPVFGGGTANTEFEFLTGISTKLFPPGAVPYIQYISRPAPTIAWKFSQAGYQTIGMHPFYASFWNREKVYPNLGIDKLLDISYFQNFKRNKFYTSDDALTDSIMDQLRNAQKPMFIFTVSMANHGPFSDDRYSDLPPIKINWDRVPNILPADYDTLSTYSIGVRESRRALGELIDTLQKAGAPPTIVVFYGDHLPILGQDFRIYKNSGFVSDEEFTNNKSFFSTPYLIWSNLLELTLDWPNNLSLPLMGQNLIAEAGLGKSRFSLTVEEINLGLFFDKDSSLNSKLEAANQDYETLYRYVAFETFFGEKAPWSFYGLQEPKHNNLSRSKE